MPDVDALTAARVFPARAGMSRAELIASIASLGVPRASGDEPVRDVLITVKGECSPRERG